MNDSMLAATPLLDYLHPSLQELIRTRGWMRLDEHARIGAVYAFVRDEIRFGYNRSDDLPASRVLADGLGQCNTKTTLLMALLRGAGIRCRFHGATIDKSLQRGVVNGVFYAIAPQQILHSWAEVQVGERWVRLEGVILDATYLEELRARFPGSKAFLGYGAGTDDLQRPEVEWNGTDTAIQMTGVSEDLGVFDDPDAFYRARGVNLHGWRRVVFESVVRHVMNRNVASLRAGAPCADRAVELPLFNNPKPTHP